MTDEPVGKTPEEHKDYLEIIKSDIKIDKKFIEDTGSPAKIIYFCKDCEKLVTPKRIGKKLRFKCDECKNENVAFGTEESIHNFFKIKTSKK